MSRITKWPNTYYEHNMKCRSIQRIIVCLNFFRRYLFNWHPKNDLKCSIVLFQKKVKNVTKPTQKSYNSFPFSNNSPVNTPGSLSRLYRT